MAHVAFPKRIFMATDLSARCDRALARAARLASSWQSELIVAHVVHAAEVARRDQVTNSVPSWRRSQSWVGTLLAKLDEDLDAEGINAKSRVVVGSPADAVQQGVSDEEAGLVVLGIAKDARMDRIQLGSTVDMLLRHCRVPVLNVRGRARADYRHILVATDFSAPSMQALRLAARWFEGARLSVFHAYTPPGSTKATQPASEDSWRAAATQECAVHLTKAHLPETAIGSVQQVIERGEPQALLADYVAIAGVDLVVLGSQGRTGLARVLLGSTAENLLHSLDCDTLVVRGD